MRGLILLGSVAVAFVPWMAIIMGVREWFNIPVRPLVSLGVFIVLVLIVAVSMFRVQGGYNNRGGKRC